MGLDTEIENTGLQPGDTDITDQVLGGDGAVGDQADDNMLAGYESAHGSESGAEIPEPEAKAEGEAADTPAPAASPAPAPVKIGRWTEDEIAERFGHIDSLKKAADTLSGHIGDLRNRLAGSKPRQFTIEDVPKVRSEFGDEFAQAFVEDLNKLGLGGPAVIPQDAIQSLMRDQLAQAEQAIERKLEYKAVLRRHRDAPDYFIQQDAEGKPVIGKHAMEFRAWVSSLPQERQQEIATSWDRDVMATALTEFKEHQKKAAAPAAPQAATRQNRLLRAVAPQGSGGAQRPAEPDPFEAGYKAARGGG